MKKILITLTILSLAVIAFAQNEFKQGHLTYSISITGNEQAADAMKGSTMTISKQDSMLRTDMNTNMVQTKTIIDLGAKKGTMLMDMMGNKYAITFSPDDIKKEQESRDNSYDVKYVDSTRLIGSHICKKAIITMKGDKAELTVWYDPTINVSLPGKNMYSKIKGLLVEYEIEQRGITMLMTLTDFDTNPVDPSLFKVSTDGYTVMTYGDFMSSMGQGMH